MASLSPYLPSYSTASNPTATFNYSPTSTSYNPVYGGVPGKVGAPSSQYEQALAAAPGLAGVTPQVASTIGSEVQGNLSPETINAIKNQAAAWGVSSGMPGSDISANKALSTIGLTAEQLQGQGVGQYNQFLGALGYQQISPALQAQIAEWNATNTAAPNPTAANQELQKLIAPAAPKPFDPYSLGPGTQQTGAGTYFTPYLGP